MPGFERQWGSKKWPKLPHGVLAVGRYGGGTRQEWAEDTIEGWVVLSARRCGVSGGAAASRFVLRVPALRFVRCWAKVNQGAMPESRSHRRFCRIS